MPTGWIEQPTSSCPKGVCVSQEVLVTRSTTELSGHSRRNFYSTYKQSGHNRRKTKIFQLPIRGVRTSDMLLHHVGSFEFFAKK